MQKKKKKEYRSISYLDSVRNMKADSIAKVRRQTVALDVVLAKHVLMKTGLVATLTPLL